MNTRVVLAGVVLFLASCGSYAGFRFDFDFASRRGLAYRGIGVGEIVGDTLSFVLYFAPAEFYFERDRASVEQLLGSIRTR